MQKIMRRFLKRMMKPRLEENETRHAMVGRPELWKMKREFQIDFLKAVGLKPNHYLLDIGCGTLRGGIPLIDYLEIGHYYGVESRKIVLQEGQKEITKYDLEHKEPVLIWAENIACLKFNTNFDFVWAFSVLFHMEDIILDHTCELVHKYLKPNGFFYANVNIGNHKAENWRGFPVIWRSLEFYSELAAQKGFKISDLGTLESLGHNTGILTQDRQRMLRFRKVQ